MECPKSEPKMEVSGNPIIITMLPEEVQRKILSYLSLSDKRSARLVCKLWANLTDDLVNFKVSLTNDNLKYFKKFPNRVNSVTMGRSAKPLSLTSQDRKILSEAQLVELSNGPSQLEIITPPNCSENIEIILKACKNISELRITGEFMGSVLLSAPLQLQSIKLLNLTSIFINLDEVLDGLVLRALAKLQVPNLKCLEFHREHFYCGGFSLDSEIFCAVYEFIKAHEDKVKTLKMSNAITAVVVPSPFSSFNPRKKLRSWDSSPLGNGTVTAIPTAILQLGLEPLLNLKLESLEITHSVDTIDNNWEISRAIFSNQRSLKSIKIEVKYYHLYTILMELVRQNRELERLEIDLGILQYRFWAPLILDFEYFKFCTKLENMRVNASPYYSPTNEMSMPRSVKNFYWSGKLDYDQVLSLASNLICLEHVTFNHIFTLGPLSRQRRIINPSSAYFDANLIARFRQIPNIISLRICFCDIRRAIIALVDYCHLNNITIKRDFPTNFNLCDFPNCDSSVCTFTFGRI